MRSRRRLLAAGAVLLAALAAAAVVLAQSPSSNHANRATGVPAGETTTAVTRRTLTESSTVDGTLGYGGTLELYDRLSGTFTWLPAVGSVIRRGQALFRLNNLPVALMYGAVPAYRAMQQGIGDGPDVSELNENLIDLGFDPYGTIANVEEFSEATAAAVRRWQKADGLPQTGAVELGRIVFAPGARRVTEVHVTLGQDPPAGGSGAQEPTGKAPSANPRAARRPRSKRKAPRKAATKAPASETPASKDDAEASAGAGMVVLSTTSTRQLVALKVKAEEQELARVGESAPVTLPGGDVVEGRITEVGSVAESKEAEKGAGGEKGASPSGEGESATIAVTLVLAHPVAHLDEAPVSVELLKSIRHDVLTVPATALTATAGDGYAIETLHGERRVELAVTPGMFADGYVQVEGAGIHAGLTVIESE